MGVRELSLNAAAIHLVTTAAAEQPFADVAGEEAIQHEVGEALPTVPAALKRNHEVIWSLCCSFVFVDVFFPVLL